MTMTHEQALGIVFYCDDLRQDITIRDWFKAVLRKLWDQGEGFSGKRPLGNSGWDAVFVVPLVENKIIDGAIYEDGGHKYCDEYNEAQYGSFIMGMIAKL